MAAMVGGSFTATTVNRNSAVAAAPLVSVTLTVIVALPFWLVAGRICISRLAPLPVKVMLVAATNSGFDERALRRRSARAESMSPTVRLTGSGMSSSTVWLVMAARVGG